MKRRSGIAGNDAYASWELWNAALAIEQTLACEFISGLKETLVQVSIACLMHRGYVKGVLSAWRIDFNPSADDNIYAVLGFKSQHSGSALEHYTPNACILVLECEIYMSGAILQLQCGDLALYLDASKPNIVCKKRIHIFI